MMIEIIKNFGYIKEVYNNILSESLTNKEKHGKTIFKDYVKLLKEDEILKTQFLVYSNIENKVETDIAKATMFVNENIALFSKYKKEDIIESNKKLVSNSLFEKNNISGNKDLYENISTLIFTPKTPQTIDAIVESTQKVVEFIMNNKEKEKNETFGLPTSMVSNLMLEKYNQKYANLSETEKKVLKVLIESSDEEKKNIYSQILNECLSLINEKLDGDNDASTLEKLLKVKEKLLNDKQGITEDFVKQISKLVELKVGLGD